jgi:hypothetical protein
MTRISRTPTDDNDRPSGEKVAGVIVNQAAALLTSRNCFDQTAFRQFLKEAELVIALPDEITAGSIHEAAEGVASGFTRWMARGLQCSPAEVTAIDLELATETTKVLKARGDYDEAALADYIADAGLCIALPDEINADGMHAAAEGVASDFTRWVASGLPPTRLAASRGVRRP